ncbi:hypothetical protein JTE90_017963 [Oedothorax gibbosus]|uniref:Uncharacterized protein n=1 Tax=Oedothorax gibbosus TaxID=931172 RepID=A0AAV6V997_9ARAC|nr:hypothetical protein JTE90_017963 [Oedothorax gibbosus]
MELSRKIGIVVVLCFLVLRILAPVAANNNEDDLRYTKRSTMLLNRLMNALNNSFHQESRSTKVKAESILFLHCFWYR